MTRTEELIASSQAGNETAKEMLVTENAGLIWSVTRRFMGRGVESDDLYQLGCLGFLKAVDGFDLQYGTQFSTYAVPKIAGEIRRFLRDDGSVKVSRSIKEQAAQIAAILVPIPNGIGVVTGRYLRAANTAAVPQIRFLHESTTLCSVSGTISYSSAQGKRGSFRCPSCCYNFMENQN